MITPVLFFVADALPHGPCKQLMRPEGLLEKDLSSTMEQYPDHFDPTILNGPPPPVERMPAPSSSGATPSINVNHMIANGMRSNLQSSVVGPSGVSGGVSSQQGVAGLAASIANPEQVCMLQAHSAQISAKCPRLSALLMCFVLAITML